jgi:hypothetical protein
MHCNHRPHCNVRCERTWNRRAYSRALQTRRMLWPKRKRLMRIACAIEPMPCGKRMVGPTAGQMNIGGRPDPRSTPKTLNPATKILTMARRNASHRLPLRRRPVEHRRSAQIVMAAPGLDPTGFTHRDRACAKYTSPTKWERSARKACRVRVLPVGSPLTRCASHADLSPHGGARCTIWRIRRPQRPPGYCTNAMCECSRGLIR